MKKFAIFIAISLNIILCFSTALAADVQGNAAKTLDYYRIRYAGNMTAKMYLNDVPLDYFNQKNVFIDEPMSQWILPGKNILQLKIAPTKEKDASLKITLVSYKKGIKSLAEEKTLITYKWKKGDAASQTFKIDVKNPPVSNFWKTAKPITLSKKNKEAALAEFRKLEKAIAAGQNSEAVKELLKYKMTEINNTFNYDEPLTIPFPTSETMETIKSVPDNKLSFKLIANKRILWIYRSGAAAIDKFGDYDSSALRVENAEGTAGFNMPVYMAPVNGKWTFVR